MPLAMLGPIAGLIGGGLNIFNATQPPAINRMLPYGSPQLPFGQQVAGNLVTGIGNIPTTDYGTAGTGVNQVYNFLQSPYAQQYLTGAQGAAALGQGAAGAQYGLGANLLGPDANWFFNLSNAVQGAAQPLPGMASSIWQTAADPQQQLYSRTLQQVTDQTRAAESARGIAMTPYGAGVENKAISDFNIDWQNQQLQRMLAGGQGAGSLLNQFGGLETTAGGLLGTGIGTQAQGIEQMLGGAQNYARFAGLPYSIQTGMLGTNLGALGQLQGLAGGAQQLQMTPLQAYQNYLQAVNQSAGIGTQAGNVLGGQQQQQQQNLGTGITGIASNLGKLFPGGGATGWGSGAQQPTGWQLAGAYGTPSQLFPGYTGGAA